MAGKQDLKVCIRGTACFLLLPQETPGRSRLSDSCPVSWLSCVLDNDYGLANRDGSQEMLKSVSQGLSVSRQTMLHPFPESGTGFHFTGLALYTLGQWACCAPEEKDADNVSSVSLKHSPRPCKPCNAFLRLQSDKEWVW